MSQANRRSCLSGLMGKSVQISKCQMCINTFQLLSMQAIVCVCVGGLNPLWRVWSHHTHTQCSQIHQRVESPHTCYNDSLKQEAGVCVCVCRVSSDFRSPPKEKNVPFETAARRGQLPSTASIFSCWRVTMTRMAAGFLSSVLHRHSCHYCHTSWWVICASLVEQALLDLSCPVS